MDKDPGGEAAEQRGGAGLSAVIEELKLRNFEGYREAEVKFSAGLNLIKGRNSTGKSTLLDAVVYGIFGEAGVKPRLLFSRLPGSREMAVYVRFRSPRNGAEIEVLRRGELDREGAYRTVERLLRVDGVEMPVEGDEDLRAKITSLLGVSLRKFLSLIYVRQGRLTEILEPEKEQMDSVIGITLLR
ncbi:MAG: AAA family ATPase, partial [Candidatus Bathyarchaeia archaeon]